MWWFPTRFPYMALLASLYCNCLLHFIVYPIRIKQVTIKPQTVQIWITFHLEVTGIRCVLKLLSEIKIKFILKVETCVSLSFKVKKSKQQVNSSREQLTLHSLRNCEKINSRRHKIYTWCQEVLIHFYWVNFFKLAKREQCVTAYIC